MVDAACQINADAFRSTGGTAKAATWESAADARAASAAATLQAAAVADCSNQNNQSV
jgi:hypothetical protein